MDAKTFYFEIYTKLVDVRVGWVLNAASEEAALHNHKNP